MPTASNTFPARGPVVRDVAIVDYGMGNVASVANMIRKVGGKSQFSADPAVIAAARRVILPGVVCSLDLYRLNLHQGGEVWQTMIRAFAQRPSARKRLFEDFLDHALLAIPFACVEAEEREWYEIDTEAELKDAENVFVSVDRQSGQL